MQNAIKSAKKAINLNPNSMDFNSFLGYLFFRRSVEADEYKKAIQQFNIALNISNPTDPAQETLLTDQEIHCLSPTYHARIEEARKCILENIGDCLFNLKILKAISTIEESLRILDVKDNEEWIRVAWYSWSSKGKLQYLEEEVEDIECTIAMRKAREAYLLAASDPQMALEQIQDLCIEHNDIGLLFRTQAEIHRKCYGEATGLDDKEKFTQNAIQCAKKAITLSPNSMGFSSFLGHLFYRGSVEAVEANDCKKAIEQFNTALNIPRPSDPAQDNLFTDHEVLSLSPTYEGRVEDARKCILKQIGGCLLILKELNEYSTITECLQTVEVKSNEERLRVAWYSLSLREKRQLLEEYLGGTVRTIATKENDAATGTGEVVRSLKVKEPIGEPDIVGVPGPEVPKEANHVDIEGFEEEYLDLKGFELLVQSKSNLLILTGQKNLLPNCYVNYISQACKGTSQVLSKGPMALIVTREELVQHTISLFPEKFKVVDLTSVSGMIGSDVVVTTSEQLGSYILLAKEDQEFDGICFAVIDNFDAVFSGSSNKWKWSIFRSLRTAQVIVINPECNNAVNNVVQLLSGPKILDCRIVD